MEVHFRTSKFAKQAQTIASAKQTWGEIRGKLLRRRLDELVAAENLEIMRRVPAAKCHELTGNLKGFLAVNLDQPYRLLFIPYHDPLPLKPDGGLEWSKVTAICVTEIVDYHG